MPVDALSTTKRTIMLTQLSKIPAHLRADTLRRCKILATIGPASNPMQLVMAGASAFRLNFSHGDPETHLKRLESIREVEKELGIHIPILGDLQGPKIRVGKFVDGQITLKYGQEVALEYSKEPGEEGLIRLPHAELLDAIEPGDILKLDDGMMSLTITEKKGMNAKARVDIPGTLSDRKGVNLPTRRLPISALTEKDRRDLEFALSIGVDIIALSFVQTPEDVAEAKKLVDGRAMVLSKIEKPLALDSIEEIAELSDAIMVARGDLGVELPMEQVPAAQRRIVSVCRKMGKPVVVATQMLQTMIDSPVPTRAEASDVAAAVYMGVDAVMLSAESAVGKHPATAVAVMDRIIRAVETDPYYWEDMESRRQKAKASATNALCAAARNISKIIDSKAIFAFSRTGSTVLATARERPRCPILGLTPDVNTARRLGLAWGVKPALSPDLQEFDAMMSWARDFALEELSATPEDKVVVLAGAPFGVPGSTNTLKIMALSD
jgi:pyruvate kinase